MNSDTVIKAFDEIRNAYNAIARYYQDDLDADPKVVAKRLREIAEGMSE